MDRLKAWLTSQLRSGFIIVFVLVLLAPLFLAGGVLFLQCLGWLREATWQPVPLAALFLSPSAQVSTLLVVSIKVNAISIVPSLGEFSDLVEISWWMAGKFQGLQQIFAWVLSTPLTVWLVALTAGIWAATQAAANEMKLFA